MRDIRAITLESNSFAEERKTLWEKEGEFAHHEMARRLINSESNNNN